MAGFGFSEAQEMFRREVRDFARKELSSGAKERAKQHKLPRDVIKKLGDMGLLGVCLPEQYGGQGSDWVSFCIGIEEVGKVDLLAGFSMLLPPVSYLCLQFTSEAVRQEWVPRFIKGDKVSSFVVSEPDAGSDAGAIKARAVRVGDHYVLNGEKTSISFGYECDAGIVFAKTDPEAKARGVTCFLVPFDLPGITRSLLPHSGWKPIGAASIIFDDVRIPAEYRSGEEGKGFHIFAGSGADFLRPALAILALAVAETSLDDAVSYALQRTAFGMPIAKFEGVSFKIAEHATRIEAARLLCYRTFYLHDLGVPHPKESAMCKWWCPVVAFDAVHDAILIHGHVGYSEEYPLEQRLRDIMGFEFADGTAQIMKIIIAREMMGRAAVPY
ncbi:MAG: acyl-CoA dehydrogenase family protein [Chloroflexota bacterium]